MDVPQSLIDKLANGKVIPFVGAGVSMAILRKDSEERLFPCWKDLLFLSAEQLEKEGKKNDATYVRSALALDEPNFLSIAAHAKKQLGAGWASFLKNVFNPPRDTIHEDCLALPQLIWNLGSKLIITSNYDKVLRWSCPNADDCEAWNIEHKAEKADFLANQQIQKPTVWHLHGCIEDASRIILANDGYNLLYGDDNIEEVYKAALHTFRSALSSFTFLFIGFSFNDEHLGVQFRGIDSMFDGCAGTHYALVREKEKARLRVLKLPIEPITFSDFGHPLIDRLEELSRYAAAVTQPSPVTASIPPTPTFKTAPPVQSRYSPANPVFHVPFARKGGQVVGREEILARVRQQLTEGKRTAIGHTASFQGLGGLGKTQLAIEYAYEYRESYPNGVIWINADQDIDAQLTELAITAEWIAPESEHKDKLAAARHRLKTYGDCLVIFDNLEDRNIITPYLPERQETAHILVTSRMDQPGFTPIPLDPLDTERSLELLYQDACRTADTLEEDTAAREIVTILGGLPLAIELAGAYLCHRRTFTFSDYQARLRDDPLKALPERYLSSFTGHDPDLFRTLKINEELFHEEPLLTPVLDILTWSGPGFMGINLMAYMLEKSKNDLLGALALGVELRIIQKAPDSDRYAIHRLVREVRRAETPLGERGDWLVSTANRLGDWFQNLRKNFHHLPQYEAEIDHLNTWCEVCERFPQLNIRLTWLQAYPPYHRGDYWRAHEIVKHAMYLVEQNRAEPDELHAHVLNDFGATFGFIGDLNNSLRYHEQALTIQISQLGDNHTDTAFSFSNVGSIYGKLGYYNKALEFQQKALDIQRALLSDNHPDTARTLGNVGYTYGELGDHKKALEFQQKALDIRQTLFGDNHPDTAISLGNVGYTYVKLGDNTKAFEFLQKALDIQRALFGENHPDTARSFDNVGSTYGELGDHKKALEFQQKALDIRQALFGDNHPDASTSFNNVGGTYSALGDHKKALEFLQKALGIRLALFGDNHPDTANSFNNIGNTYSEQGDHKKALEFQQKTLDIQQALFSNNHPNIATSFNNIGYTYGALGDHKKALEFQQKALDIRRALFGNNHPDIANSLFNISSTYCHHGKVHLASDFLRKAIHIARQVFPEKHPTTVMMEKRLRLSEAHTNGFRKHPQKKKRR